MIFSSDRSQLRYQFITAWKNYQDGQPLSGLEQQIVEVIRQHPEYHAYLNPEAVGQDFFAQGQSNPFLHLALHLAVREQRVTDRPTGISQIYHRLCQQMDFHEAEHRMMDILEQVLWNAQRAGQLPDEQDYLQKLQQLKGYC